MATKKSSFKDYMRRAAAEAAKSIEVPQDPPPAEEEIQEPIPVQPPAAEPAPTPQRREEEPVVVITASEQPSYLASSDPVEYSCASLGATAVLLLHYLIENKSRHINVSRVALYRRDGSLIPYPTVRNAWNRIIDLGFIDHKRVYSQGVNKGVHYILNEFMVSTFLRIHGGVVHESSAVQEQPARTAPRQLPLEEAKPSVTFLLETHPEFSLWREAGVTSRQQSRWEEEFGIEHELMDTYMRWCAWDVSHRSEAINSIANYFYRSLQRSGGYARPEGYVSLEEKRLATLEEERVRKQELQRREEALLAEEAENSLRGYFEELLARRGDDPLYSELVESMPTFIRAQEDPSSKMHALFKKNLYEALKKKVGIAY